MSFIELLIVCLGLLQLCIAAENISWTLSTNPEIFGKNFLHTCTLNNTSAIKENTLKNVDIQVMDGNQLTKKNQSEKANQMHRDYNMTISVNTDDGASVPYRCNHGDVTYNNLKHVNLEIFKYNTSPLPQTVNNSISKDELFSIEIKNSLKPPTCTVLYGNKNFTSVLKTDKSSTKVYLMTKALNHTKCLLMPLKITCQAGSATIVYQFKPESNHCNPSTVQPVHSAQTEGKKEKDQTIGYLGLGIFCIVTVVFVGGFLVGLAMKKLSG